MPILLSVLLPLLVGLGIAAGLRRRSDGRLALAAGAAALLGNGLSVVFC